MRKLPVSAGHPGRLTRAKPCKLTAYTLLESGTQSRACNSLQFSTTRQTRKRNLNSCFGPSGKTQSCGTVASRKRLTVPSGGHHLHLQSTQNHGPGAPYFRIKNVMYLYAYVLVSMYTYIYMYMSVFVYICTHVSVSICMCTYIHMFSCLSIYSLIHLYPITLG